MNRTALDVIAMVIGVVAMVVGIGSVVGARRGARSAERSMHRSLLVWAAVDRNYAHPVWRYLYQRKPRLREIRARREPARLTPEQEAWQEATAW